MGLHTLVLMREADAFFDRLAGMADRAIGPDAAFRADQLRRAADSVPSNIAEGYGRGVSRSCLQFLGFAYASLMEAEGHLIRGAKRGTFPQTEVDEALKHLIRVRYLLIKFRKSVERRIAEAEAFRRNQKRKPKPGDTV